MSVSLFITVQPVRYSCTTREATHSRVVPRTIIAKYDCELDIVLGWQNANINKHKVDLAESMKDENLPNFSEVLATHFKRLKEWMKPDPQDHLALKIVKTVFKSLAMLVLLLFSPVLLLGLALGFIGLM